MADDELAELNKWMQLAGQRANTIEKQSNSLLRCARQIKKLEKDVRVWQGNAEFHAMENNRLRRGLEKMRDATEAPRVFGKEELNAGVLGMDAVRSGELG